MKYKFVYICSIVAIVIIAAAIIVLARWKSAGHSSGVQDANEKIRQCPDEWINNQMPTTGQEKSNSEYFIINGQRREVDEFDLDWIQKNCVIKKQTVF